MVKDKFSDSNNYVEIKLFPGLKVTSKYIPPEQFTSNLGISNMDSVLMLNAEFSKNFKNKIKTPITGFSVMGVGFLSSIIRDYKTQISFLMKQHHQRICFCGHICRSEHHRS